MQTRNAARVLPLPVGAEMRVASPARMLGQPWVLGLGGAAEFGEEPLGGDGVGPGEGFGDFERHSLIVARICSLFVRCPAGRVRLRAARPLRGGFTLSRVGEGHSPPVGREGIGFCLHVALAYVGGGGCIAGFVEVLLDDLFEGALGGEDEVDGVAAGSEAAGVWGDVVGGGL